MAFRSYSSYSHAQLRVSSAIFHYHLTFNCYFSALCGMCVIQMSGRLLCDSDIVEYIYTVSQKKLGHFFTAYNFRIIEQIFTKFGKNQSLFILNIVPEFI